MICAAHRTAVAGSIRSLELFFMLLIIFFTAFLTAGNIIKTCSRFFRSGIITIPLAVSAKFITRICVFIFIEASALTVEITVLPLITLTLSLALTVASVKASALTVEITVLALMKSRFWP